MGTHYRLSIFFSILLLGISTACLADAEVLHIGVIAPLTGDFASAGNNIRRGITLAEADLQQEHGSIQIHFEDACLPAPGVTAFKKLVEQEKVQALVSTYCVITLGAIRDMVEKQKIPTLHNSMFPEKLLKGSGYILSTWPSIDREAVEMSRYLDTDVHAKKVGVLYLITPWGEGYADAFKAAHISNGGTIAGWEGNAIGTNDFRAELTRIRSARPEALLMIHAGAMLSNALKQMRSLGLKIPVVVPGEADDPAVLSAADGSAVGISLFSSESMTESEKSKSFGERFQAKFGEPPTALARHAYDELILMVKAFSRCKGKRECVPNAIKTMGAFDGASGIFTFGNDGGAQRTFVRKVAGQLKFNVSQAPN